MEIKKVNIKEKFGLINEFWSPNIAGELNDNFVKLAKIKGEFIWHFHKDEDEMFLVIKGNFDMHIKLTEDVSDEKKVAMKNESCKDIVINEKVIKIKEGEFIIIPKGVIHKPVAEEEVHLLLIEPKTTLNTGDQKESELTKNKLKYL